MDTSMLPAPPKTPPTRMIREGAGAFCDFCGSSMMRKQYLVFGRRPGCIQPDCRNFGGDRYMVRVMKVRTLAAKLWLEDGGHIPYQNGGLIHSFMMQMPETRLEYEARAEQMLGGPQ